MRTTKLTILNFITINNLSMLHEYTKAELNSMDTIEQAWDGDELKIKTDTHRIWLVLRENRMYNGDYVVETNVDGRWEQASYYFN
jgi:hypothetical protein